MKLSPPRFNRLLTPPGGLGQKVLWRRAYACPCFNPHSQQARPGCPQCDASGTLYVEGVKAHTGVSSMKVARAWQASTQYEIGDVVWTIPSNSPLYNAGEGDRVVMTDSSEPFSTILFRGDVVERIRGTLVNIERAFRLDPNTSDIIELGIPAFDAEGNILWTGVSPAPAEGQQYSLTGRKRQEYYIFQDFPQDRAHHGGLPLPRRVVARRYDLAGRSS